VPRRPLDGLIHDLYYLEGDPPSCCRRRPRRCSPWSLIRV